MGWALLVCVMLCSIAAMLYTACLWSLSSARRRPRIGHVCGVMSLPQGVSVTVVLAARDEASNVGACLASLLDQEGVEKIVFVDDHSSDETLSIAQHIGAQTPRLQVVSAPELPPDWIGKSYALFIGTQHVTTSHVLFTDADVIFAPGTVKRACCRMIDQNLDHVGGHFFIQCATVPEQIAAPVMTAASVIALCALAERRGAGTGAFNLFRTSFYRAIGGHESIHGTVLDDIALARLAKGRGGRCAFLLNTGEVSVRLFCGFKGFYSSVFRSAVPYLRGQGTFLLVAAVLLCAIALATVACVPMALAASAWGETNLPLRLVALATGTAAYVIGFAVVFQVRSYHSGKIGWGFLYPLPLLVMGFATSSAVLARVVGRKVKWRGRTYSHG